jgi:Trypsin
VGPENQNGRITQQLLAARLSPQNAAAHRLFGPTFRSPLMLAAGRYHKGDGTYAGACYGDSGGPLVTTMKKIRYIVGVTSWGARGCDVKKPTVFTSVSAYRSWLTSARRSLPREASQDNRALPEPLTDPTIAGTVALGSTLTCMPAQWTANANTTSVGWWDGDDTRIGSGATHVVSIADAGTSLRCEVVAYSDAGRSSDPSASIAVPNAPTEYSTAAITGTGTGLPAPGTVATCALDDPQPGTTTSYVWTGADSYGGTGQVLGSGPALTLTEAVLRSVAGRYLVCTATTSNAMGSASADTTDYIYSLRPPSISVTVTPSTIVAGTVASCGVTDYSQHSSVTYRWAIQPDYPGATIAAGAQVLPGTGQTYTVTAADRAAMTGYKYFVCEATATSWQGSDVDAGGVWVY